MSDQPKDGGSITPILESRRQVSQGTFLVDQIIPIGGLTIRDWFAGMVISELSRQLHVNGFFAPDEAAIRAYRTADAMIAARERKEVGQ